ncbi:MAG: alpha/beta fold hydrolase [Dehalococcoidia bacterium]|nr:alpha/beta fold hydrolase [Dehalococcoidia bacterium]
MPAALRYAPLLRELDGIQPVVKDLEVYSQDAPPPDYSIDHEVEGVSRAADAAGLDRFHIYGHSAGGAIALAYVARHPERVLSLAIDEPATDFSDADKAILKADLDRIAAMPAPDPMRAFMQMQLAPGVDLPAPPPGPAPGWMALRPAGIAAFTAALMRHTLAPGTLSEFLGPVY